MKKEFLNKIILSKFYSRGTNRDGVMTESVRQNPKKSRFFFVIFLSLN